jgi:hypothetical protein
MSAMSRNVRLKSVSRITGVLGSSLEHDGEEGRDAEEAGRAYASVSMTPPDAAGSLQRGGAYQMGDV